MDLNSLLEETDNGLVPTETSVFGLAYIHSIQFETGYAPLKIADYAKENSNLEEAFSTVSPYASGGVKTNKSNRIKYSCPNCKTNVWGKEGLSLRCGACESPFIIAD